MLNFNEGPSPLGFIKTNFFYNCNSTTINSICSTILQKTSVLETCYAVIDFYPQYKKY